MQPRSTWIALLLCYAGVALVVSHDLGAGGDEILLGGALVFASGVSYAVYLLRAGPLLLRLGSARVTAWGTVIACVLALAQFVALRPIATLVAQPWQVQALSAAMAVFSTVLPVWLVIGGVRRVAVAK